MAVRMLMIAATLMSATVASAEPTASGAQPAKPQAPHPVDVVMASAERLAPSASQPSDIQQVTPPAPRKRAARVTTCRCGDPGQ